MNVPTCTVLLKIKGDCKLESESTTCQPVFTFRSGKLKGIFILHKTKNSYRWKTNAKMLTSSQ